MHILFKEALSCILLNLLHCFSPVLFYTLLCNGQYLRSFVAEKSALRVVAWPQHAKNYYYGSYGEVHILWNTEFREKKSIVNNFVASFIIVRCMKALCALFTWSSITANHSFPLKQTIYQIQFTALCFKFLRVVEDYVTCGILM